MKPASLLSVAATLAALTALATFAAETVAPATVPSADTAPAADLTADQPAPAVEPPAAVLDQTFLNNVALHLYRWYLDEEDIDPDLVGQETPIRFHVRRLTPELDFGDKSEWAEVAIPQLGLAVVLKRPDYVIEELGAAVHGSTFRIVHVRRIEATAPVPDPADGWQHVSCSFAKLMADIKENIENLRFPDEALTDRLRRASRSSLGLDPDKREEGDLVMHIAPLSDVANELWVYIENECLLVRFTTDSDIESPELWATQRLGVDAFDVRNETVVTLDEAPGSNVVLTKDQVGRALYNCVVHGKRIIVINPADPDAPPLHFEHTPPPINF